MPINVEELIEQLRTHDPKARVKVMIRRSKRHGVDGILPHAPIDDDYDREAILECVSTDRGAREPVVIEAWV